ncbi:MAG: aminotransferase class I/II-fold pyridoxal phosphate-dependent enzyme [Rhodospirillaceae bacterium]|nr:aminotransferase class I/II-fold pyridoxal phosphate-dependent enzyme [Rhodospirillaceae bacterium]MBT6116314.1 aminotransferase class I/II-fold pyridoxal phosphate-dependent enzyme [Rhodospirillaceae bacterium]
MAYSSLVERVADEGARAWDVHVRGRELEAEGHDVIFLGVGDPDFDTPAEITRTAIDALHNGRTHYPGAAGIPELRAAIARYRTERTGQPVEADRVIVCPGAQNGLYVTLACLVEAGDEVIVLDPAYATYRATVRSSGAEPVGVPLRAENGFHLDPADLAAAVTARTRAVLINFPHNPTGAMVEADELSALAEICQRHDLWLVSDEVYAEVTYDGRSQRSPALVPGLEDRTVVIDSLSKSRAMTGWRTGWIIAPGGMAAHIENVMQCMLYGCAMFIQDAAVTAVSREFQETSAMRAEFSVRRDTVAARIGAIPRLACLPPEGGMFLMIDIRETGLDSLTFANRLVEEEKVVLLAGASFGASAEGFLRLSLTSPRAQLERACERLARFTARL